MLRDNSNMVIMMSDETHFHLNASVNKQNCWYWAMNHPQQMYEWPLHSPQVTVWCAIAKCRVISPYLALKNMALLLQSHQIATSKWSTIFSYQNYRRNRYWEFQQKGATAHSDRASSCSRTNHFTFWRVPWPPRSPDLSVCDFFSWGLLKSGV